MSEKLHSNEMQSRPRHVWLVDDDEAMGVLVTDILEPEGHTVSYKGTMNEALASVDKVVRGEELPPDAVILDYHLNHDNAAWDDQTGRVVQQAVHEQLGNVPIIGFSGRTMDTHDMGGLYTDLTKDGVWNLPEVIGNLPEHQSAEATVELPAGAMDIALPVHHTEG
jgi:CheY-like chemotaxis protein